MKLTDGDQDGDGISDFAELGTLKTGFEDCKKYEYYTFRSDPTKSDTDGDGLNDTNDSNPLTYDLILSSVDNDTIKFNNNKTFNIIFNEDFTLQEYFHDKNILEMPIFGKMYFALTAKSKYEFPNKSFEVITNDIKSNNNNYYTIEESAMLAPFDLDGIKLTSFKMDYWEKVQLYCKIDGKQLGDNYTFNDISKFYDLGIETSQEYQANYRTRIANQVVLGRWSDDVTVPGTAVEIIAGFLAPIGIAQSIRDVAYDITHWEPCPEFIGQTLLDGVGTLEIISVFKYNKNLFVLTKDSNDFAKILNIADISPNGVAKLDPKVTNLVDTASIGINKLDSDAYTTVLLKLDDLSGTNRLAYAGSYGNTIPYDNSFSRAFAECGDEFKQLDNISPDLAEDVVEKTVMDSTDATGNVIKDTDDISEIAQENVNAALSDAKTIAVKNAINTINVGDNVNCIAVISDMDNIDECAKGIAYKLRDMINTKQIVKATTGDKIKATVVTVAVDNKTGNVYYGISGFKNNPTRRSETIEFLQQRLKEVGNSKYNYSLDNCGEFNAINNALFNNAEISDLSVYSIKITEGKYIAPCNNCKELYGKYLKFIEE